MSVSQYTVSAAVCCAAHTRRTSKAAGSSCEVDKEMWRAFVVRKKSTAISRHVAETHAVWPWAWRHSDFSTLRRSWP